MGLAYIIRTGFFLVFAISELNAQKNDIVFTPVNNRDLEQYKIRHITSDIEGKLWLSTNEGLLRYDGNDVTVFRHRENDSFSLSSDDVLRTYADDKGNLFIMEVSQKINYLNGKTGKVTPLYIAHKTEDFRIMAFPSAYTDLFPDDESIWISAYYVGFCNYNLRTKQTSSYYLNSEYSGKNTVYSIRGDQKNKSLLWLGTENGIYSFNKLTKEIKRNFRCSNRADSSSLDLQVTNLEFSGTDSIWFSVPGKGMGCYDIRTGLYRTFPFKINNIQNEILEISKIQLRNTAEFYIATSRHLMGIFNIRTHEYSFNLNTSNRLPNAISDYFLADKRGNLWCIIFNRLFKATSEINKFKTIKLSNDNAEYEGKSFFQNIIWDKRNNEYYASFDNKAKVLVIDSTFTLRHTIQIEREKSGLPVDDRLAGNHNLCIDAVGRLWYCNNYLYVYDPASKKMVLSGNLSPKLNFKTPGFQNLFLKGAFLYLQSSNPDYRAIYRINLKNFTYDSIPFPPDISKDKGHAYQPGNRINYLVIDNAGRYAYMGYRLNAYLGYIDGILQLNLETGKWRKITSVNLNEHESFINTFQYATDDNSNLWVETEGGIRIYEPANCSMVKQITPQAEKFSNQLYNVESYGLMCRIYSKGIYIYDYKNNSQFNLSLSDGLISYGNTGISSVKGLLFTGGINFIQYIPVLSIIKTIIKERECYLSSFLVFNKEYITDTLPECLQSIILPYYKNFITIRFSSTEFEQAGGLEYRYKLNGVDKEWVYVNYLNRTISYNDLRPGVYTFQVAVKQPGGIWNTNDKKIIIHIRPAWWQKSEFKIFLILVLLASIYFFINRRINIITAREKLKGKYERELLELEAKALRAQMNPHFIFNCMNSIKLLIQQKKEEKAIIYLTIFSKLIRTIFQNSDKREISLYDEIETCRLYTHLESMRFENRFSYAFNIDDSLDLKYMMVPALVIQPFIENAIWHGIIPKNGEGNLKVIVEKVNASVRCIVDDNGIGREMSAKYKYSNDQATHQSKGVHLTQSRINLSNLLNQQNAKVEIIDKKDSSGKGTGTTVILTFSDY